MCKEKWTKCPAGKEPKPVERVYGDKFDAATPTELIPDNTMFLSDYDRTLNICFSGESGELGRLYEEDGQLKFSGHLHESAIVFFSELIKVWKDDKTS